MVGHNEGAPLPGQDRPTPDSQLLHDLLDLREQYGGEGLGGCRLQKIGQQSDFGCLEDVQEIEGSQKGIAGEPRNAWTLPLGLGFEGLVARSTTDFN